MRIGDHGIARRAFLAGGTGICVGLGAPAVLRAAPRVMTINSWLPPQHPVPDLVLTEWARIIEQRTEGRVTFQLLEKPLGPPPASYGLIESGKADVAFALHGFSGDDAFKRAQIGQFSFLGDSYSAGQAFASVYWDMLDPVAEHPGIKLLATFQHGPGFLFLKDRSIRGPEDFRGLRIRSSGGYISKLLQDLGAETVLMPPGAVREALESGKIDGGALSYEGGLSFNLLGLATEVSEIPGGYFNASWFLGMSNAAFDSLDRKDRRHVDRASREFIPLLAAKSFDYVDHHARTLFGEAGTALRPAPEAALTTIREASLRYEQAWIDEIGAQGFAAGRALRKMRELTGVDRG